jgi:hypothetical protein
MSLQASKIHDTSPKSSVGNNSLLLPKEQKSQIIQWASNHTTLADPSRARNSTYTYIGSRINSLREDSTIFPSVMKKKQEDVEYQTQLRTAIHNNESSSKSAFKSSKSVDKTATFYDNQRRAMEEEIFGVNTDKSIKNNHIQKSMRITNENE